MRTSLTLLAAAAVMSTAGIAQAADYAIDPTHTFATFEIGHFGASVNRARFDKKEGKVSFDKAAKTGKVDISIDMTSVNSGTAMFDKHLQSADIFDAAKFPKAQFVSSKFVFTGDKVSAVEGSLTLLGKTHPVTLKSTKFNCYQNPMLKVEVCGGDFETTIARSQWGMQWGLEYGFADNVRLVVQVEAVKQP